MSLSSDFAALVEKISASVVAVHGRPRLPSSGVSWAPGLIVTAEHTIYGDDEIAVSQGPNRMQAEVLGRDPGTDLAVLRLKESAALPGATKLPPATALQPGMIAVTVGRNTESANADLGILGSVGGPSGTRRGGRLDAVLRLGSPVHPVSSGGAVVDVAGNLIGIATPALSQFAVFAIPPSTVDRVVRAIVEHGAVRQGYLGAGLQPVALPEHLMTRFGLKNPVGLMTVSVDPDAAAGKAGMLIGDTLLEWNGEPISRPEALRPLLAEAVGKTAQLKILRGGEIAALQVEIQERPGKRA